MDKKYYKICVTYLLLGNRKNMKGSIYKTGLVFISILTCLLMISTATAVPVANAEPVMDMVEENEELLELKESIEVIINSYLSTEEKKDDILQLFNDFEEIDANVLENILWAVFMISFYLLMIAFPTPVIIINLIITSFLTCLSFFLYIIFHSFPDTLSEWIVVLVKKIIPDFLEFLITAPSILCVCLARYIVYELLDFPSKWSQPI